MPRKPTASASTPPISGEPKAIGVIAVVPRPMYVGRASSVGENSSSTLRFDTLMAATWMP